jgi:hypothetical protein
LNAGIESSVSKKNSWQTLRASLSNSVNSSLTTFTISIVVTLLLFLQGCATERFDAVIPSIARNHNWSIDAANYLHYQESLFGPRLAIYISPELKPAQAPRPVRIFLFFGNGFEAAFQLDAKQTYLEIQEKTYIATIGSCMSQDVSEEANLVVIRKLARGERRPCIALLFDAPQPAHWEEVILRLAGLSKDGIKITIPEIRFRKTLRSAPGSFS